MPCKTPAEVRAELEMKGISISAWALANGINPFLAYELLAGRKKGKRGAAHRAAVLLGLKQGEIVSAENVANALVTSVRRAA